jgi:hypothetical protein
MAAPKLNPAVIELTSRAEGIAAALGSAEVSAEHVLLAYLWDPTSDGQLAQLGTSREAVRSHLAELGTSLPQAALPAPDPRRWGSRTDVPVDELWILLGELPYVMPTGVQFIFNHDWKTGWSPRSASSIRNPAKPAGESMGAAGDRGPDRRARSPSPS